MALMSELTEEDMYYNFKNYTMCWPQLKRAGRSNQGFVGSTGLCCKKTRPQLQDFAPSLPLPPPPALRSYGSCGGKKWCGFSGRLVPATGNVYNFTEQLFYLYFCEVVNCYFHRFTISPITYSTLPLRIFPSAVDPPTLEVGRLLNESSCPPVRPPCHSPSFVQARCYDY